MSKFARTALEKNEVNEQEWLRPPYLQTYEFFDEPLYVLPAFLSRADSSPVFERRRDPTNVVNKNGKIIEDPSADPSALAFEPDANLAYEKWDEYWRKVHGMRFTHKDGLNDNSMSRMLRYDQVHRIPGGPTSYFPPPYKVPVDENGRLYESVLDRIEPYQRPQHDGLAYMAFKTLEDLQDSFGSKNKFPSRIVPEEQIMFREVPHLITKEYIIIPKSGPRDPIILIKVHKRQPDLTREQFQDFWLHEHADLVLSKLATHQYVQRYAQLHNVGPSSEGEQFWHPYGRTIDGVTVMAFASMNDVEDFLMTEDYALIARHEATFINHNESEYYTCLNYNIINRLYPEVATRR